MHIDLNTECFIKSKYKQTVTVKEPNDSFYNFKRFRGQQQ